MARLVIITIGYVLMIAISVMRAAMYVDDVSLTIVPAALRLGQHDYSY